MKITNRKWIAAGVMIGFLLISMVPVLAADEVLSKYTFVPGEKFLVTEDLSGTAVGEAPLSLHVNGEADTVMIGGEKWLKLGNDAEINIPVPGKVDDLTLEFYVRANNVENASNLTISLLNEAKNFESWVTFHFNTADWGGNYGDKELPRNTMNKTLYNINQTVPVALTIQKERIKLYINQILVMNVNGAVPVMPDKIKVIAGEGLEDADILAVREFRVATLVPDIASEILTNGKYVSHGIRFDTGSAKVKDESFAVLKQIADVLAANPDLKLTIVGHTDNVGNKQANQKLSQDRAESVKQYLITKFGVAADRLGTAGKGDTEPVADNKTPDGRSKNRRVEFIRVK